MKEIEHTLLNNPDGAFSDIDTRKSFYWIFEERLVGDARSLIHVGKVMGESFTYESASVLARGSDVLNILSTETAWRLRKVVNKG